MTYLVYCVNKLPLCSRTNIIVAEKYKMIKLLGSGAFGEIYKAYNTQNNEEFAVKFEPTKTKFP